MPIEVLLTQLLRSRLVRSPLLRSRLRTLTLLLLPFLFAADSRAQYTCAGVVVTGAVTSARVGTGTVKFTATYSGKAVPGGHWDVGNGFAYGTIDQTGLFTVPGVMPPVASSVIYYNLPGCPRTATLTLLNFAPQVSGITPTTITQLNQTINIHGAYFMPTSTVTVNGLPVAFNFVGTDVLSVNLNLTRPSNTPIPVVVTNPNPGAASSSGLLLANFPLLTTVTPTTFLGGMNTLTINGTGLTDYSTFTFDGKPLLPTKVNSGTYTANVFVAPWRNGTIPVTVNPISGAPVSSSVTIPIEKTVIPFDVAARFSTQAAFGPRIDIVQHIQHIGLAAFVTEQLQQPPVTYTDPGWYSARSQYMRAAAYGNSLLRLRVATALGTFIVNAANNDDYASFSTWENLLETAAFGNFRDFLTSMTADPSMGTFLNLAGNNASADPNIHPNQNYPRELMQLFTIGPSQLTGDATPKLGSNGQPIPTYDESTLLDLTRALTGWNYAPVVNPAFTMQTIDYSQPLIPREDLHDQGAKTLFGTVHLPAGQGIVADRKQALDAIFNHPNLGPFVALKLIQHLVKSNPTSGYIIRVAQVFANNGQGVRGDMSAVVTAILLDKEARLGDTKPSANDGFLQDPLLFELFAISALGQDFPDNQPSFNPDQLGESVWYPPSVNGPYPASYLIPGTAIASPEFALWNNRSVVQRTQMLYGMVSGTLQDFGGDYMNRSWLFQDPPDVPTLVDALNHTLYHGTMPAATQTAILNYCASLSSSTLRQQFIAAVFLALNSDSYNVSH